MFEPEYLVVPEEVYKKNDISWLEARILVYFYNSKSNLSSKHLAEIFNVPEESVLQAMASLCEKGYIHVQHENKPGGQNEGG